MEEQEPFNQIESYRSASERYAAARDILKTQLALARRDQRTIACIVLDIDHFRTTATGQRASFGQSILARAEEALTGFARPHQTLSCGRDEFLVIAKDLGLEQAFILAEKVRSQLADKLRHWAEKKMPADSPQIGCSAGVVLYPEHAADVEDILRLAKENLYRAKQQGRNQTRLPAKENMILKTNFYSSAQLERLRLLAQRQDRTEASILREALDAHLRQHDL